MPSIASWKPSATRSHTTCAPCCARFDGFSQILAEEYEAALDADGQDYLRRVRGASARMASLIDGLLDLSRVTRSQLRREQVDLSALAAAVAREVRDAQPGREGVEFVIQPGMQARGDQRLLRAVFENLLRNAWKFTSKHPTARIEVGQMEIGGETAYYVRDDGAGFEASYGHKLFQPFSRLHGAEEFEGTGIGLATVERIITRHGGRIWAEGEPERGATFYMTLQAAPAPVAVELAS
jgi:light-regulated signal transduction histidine kinase (bacteriophytochrome)